MNYRDYYQSLGIDKSASADAIKKAYRKLARRYHPDVSKEPDAATRMAELNEAYAVLSDPQRRKAYDAVGAEAWAAGARSQDDVRPPPRHHGAQASAFAGDEAGFSDFFEQMFGGHRAAGSASHGPVRGRDLHTGIMLQLADAYHGARRQFTLRASRIDEHGRLVPEERTLEVRIPRGVGQGQLIRLAGHGGPGLQGGPAGDLLLEVQFEPDPVWEVDGRDVTRHLRVTPWEAALGAEVAVGVPDGSTLQVSVPAGSGAGRRLRLKGRGIPSATPGDAYLVLEIAVPGAVTDAQRSAWEQLARAYPGFDPRLGSR